MSQRRMDSYDVIVAGGGPAGAAAATVLAQHGRRVLLAERDPEPRFKVGESLMPATYPTLERLGVLEKMKASRFPSKYSVQFFTPSGRPTAPFYFFEADPSEGSRTWQVLRSEFDQLLLENAAEQGVDVRRGLRVRQVLFDGERAVGARIDGGDGAAREVAAQVVVDATGQSALLARELGLKENEPRLLNASFFTHYEGARRDAGKDEGATLILHTESGESWFWFIPLPDDRASVGVVGSVDYLVRRRGSDPQTMFEEELARCPRLAERLEGARQVRPVQAIRDFSYRSRRVAGPGWVLVGDAYGFIDPIYSTGVFLALSSGEMAADAIAEALAAGDLSAASLGRFEPRLAAGMEMFRRLVYAFYDRDFSFSRFLSRHPELRPDLIRILMGDVYRPFDRLRSALDETLASGGERLEAALESGG